MGVGEAVCAEEGGVAWPEGAREQEVAELSGGGMRFWGGVDLVGLLEAHGMEDDYEMVDVRVAAGEEDVEVEEEVMKRLRRSGLGENG